MSFLRRAAPPGLSSSRCCIVEQKVDNVSSHVCLLLPGEEQIVEPLLLRDSPSPSKVTSGIRRQCCASSLVEKQVLPFIIDTDIRGKFHMEIIRSSSRATLPTLAKLCSPEVQVPFNET